MTAGVERTRARGAHDGGWRRLIRRLGVDLRPGEGQPAGLLFLCLFLLLTFQIATKTVRQSTFIDSLGASRLPLVYLLVALISYPILRLYNRIVDRIRVDQLLSFTSLVVAGILIVFWWLMDKPWIWVAVAFYVFTSIVYGLLASQFWLFANHLFDPRQAKRLFGFIGAGALLGGILGGQIARLASQAFGTGTVPLVAAGLLLVVAVLMYRARSLGERTESEEEGGQSKLDKARGGFQILRRSRPLQTIAAVVVLTVMVGQIVDLQFNWAVEQITTTLDQRTAFFGNFFSVMGIAAFVFQLVFAGRILRVLGIGFALRVLPVTMGVGTIALFVAAGLVPELLIAAALILKVGESGLRYSLDQSTRELLFAPVPSGLRVKAKAFIDVFIQRGAKGLAALLLLPVTFGLISAVQAGWISLVLIAVWMVVIVLASRAYVNAFRSGLKGRTVDDAVPIDLSDVTTLELLLESLGSSDSRQVLHSLDLLIANDRGDLVPPLLLYHDDAEVRRRTLIILAELGRVDVVPLIEKRLADGDPDVRAEAIRVLAGMQGQEVTEMMLPKLDDADPGIRAAAVACLANHGDQRMFEDAVAVLRDLLSDADPDVRSEAAKAIGAVHEPRFQEHLIRLLYDTNQMVIRETIAAIRRRVTRDGFNPMYVPTLVSLLQNRRVKHEAREALVAFGEPAIPALVHFMNDPDEPIWVRRALPKAIAQIGTLAASRALLQGLEEGADSFHRRNLVNSLASIKDSGALWSEASDQIRRQISFEASHYLECIAALQGLGLPEKGLLIGGTIRWDGDQVPTLLDQLLEERAEDSLRNLFGLLSLLYGGEQMWPAYLSLISDKKMLRARALEFLDNTLEAGIKRDVFAVIDDCPLAEKLQRGANQFGVRVKPKPATLGGFLDASGAPESDSSALSAAALYAAHQEQVQGLEVEVRHLAESATDPFVKETAVWIKGRLDL
jgi:AAA family ATP:ADP antiporter